MTTSGTLPVKLTALYHRHLELGATMMDYLGWQRPAHYGSPERELEALRASGGFGDISPMRKFIVQGADVPPLLNKLFPESGAPAINTAAIANLEAHNEGASSHVIVSRFAEDEVFIAFVPSEDDSTQGVLESLLHGCAHIVDMTSHFAAVRVAGPASSHLLAKLTDLPLSPESFPNMSCAQGQMAEVYTIVGRLDQGAVLSYNVYFGRDFGVYLFDAMLEAGHEYSMVPVGLESMISLVTGA